MSKNFKIPIFRLAITIGLIGVIIQIAVKAAFFSTGWPPREYENQGFLNLTRSGILWDVSYGNSSQCPTGECLVRGDTPIEAYDHHQILPNRYYAEHRETRSGKLYYRTNIPIPLDLRVSKKTMAFHFLKLYADRWEIYFNNEHFASGEGLLERNIVIPEKYLRSEILTIGLKLDAIMTSEPGFDTRGQLLIGPEEKLNTLSRQYLYSAFKTQMWFVIPRFAIAMIFVVGCLFLPFYGEALALVFFCFFTSIRILFLSGGNGLPAIGSLDPWLFVNSADYLASLSLMCFFSLYFRQRWRYLYGVVGAAVVFFAVVMYVTMLAFPRQDTLFFGTNIVRCLQTIVYAFGIYMSGKAAWELWQSRRSSLRLVIASSFLVMLVLLLPLSMARYLGLPQLFHEQLMWEMAIILIGAGSVASELGVMALERQRVLSRLHMVVDKKLMGPLFLQQEFPTIKQEDVTVLMTDLRSFTSMSETFAPNQVTEALNQYLNIVTEVVHQNGGVIDKFIGDAVLAVWGIPKQGTTDALHAVQAGMEIRRRLQELNQDREAQGQFKLYCGIAIHSGSVLFGPIGNRERIDYTVIGPTINMVTRMEGLTKKLNSDFVFSEGIYRQVQAVATVVDEGSHQLRGSSGDVRIYRMIGLFNPQSQCVETFDRTFASLDLSAKSKILASAPGNLFEPDYQQFKAQAAAKIKEAA